MMLLKDLIIRIGTIFLCLTTSLTHAFDGSNNTFQHALQVKTNVYSIVGKSILTIIIRDIDRNENIPYVFEFTPGNQYWVLPIPSHNYFVLSARLQITKYDPRCNAYKNYRINNFCHIESRGRILRGKSVDLFVQGDLSPNTNKYSCQVKTYPDGNY